MKRSYAPFVVAAALTALAAGCGGQQQATQDSGSGEQAEPETVIVYRDATDGQDDSGSPDTSQTEDTGGSQSSGSASSSSSGELPDDFPFALADDHEVQNVRDESNDVDVDLQVPDGQAAYDYYLQTLQDDGFTIEESQTGTDDGQFDGDIDFVNDQFDGSVDVSGQFVEIDIDRLGSTASSGTSSDDSGQQSSGATSSTELPQGFPVTLPGDAQIQNVREGGDDPDDAEDVDVDFDVSDGQSAYDEFLQSLESDGFTIEDSQTGTDDGQFDGEIDFYNNDYDGSVSFEGTRGELDLGARNQ